MGMNKLIVKKPVIGKTDWSVIKYKREVFYKNLWNEDPEFMEARGKVVDSLGNVIALPLRKVFNYLENDAGKELTEGSLVEVTKKINGSMFHVTATALGLLFGTTGSAVLGDIETENEFLKRGRDFFHQHIDALQFIKLSNGNTYIFEVVDNINDPHVIAGEADGLYLLSIRSLSGEMFGTDYVEMNASILNHVSNKEKKLKVPSSCVLSWGELLKSIRDCKHEGFMVRLWGNGEFICKLKSPYYLNKKRAQRINPEKLFSDQWREYFDDDFYATVSEIRNSFRKEDWEELSEVERSELFDKVYKNMVFQQDILNA